MMIFISPHNKLFKKKNAIRLKYKYAIYTSWLKYTHSSMSIFLIFVFLKMGEGGHKLKKNKIIKKKPF